MISFIIPTRNRPEALRRTLGMIERCCERIPCDAEIIVIDNASDESVDVSLGPRSRASLRLVRSKENIGAAARNIGAQEATHNWIVMLDDDSYPLDSNLVQVLDEAPDDVAAIGAEIVLPDGSRERGGLPEVIVGCGALIRRDAFLDVGGYDPSFDYYAEEYDLCAKLLMRGWRVTHDCRFRVRHEKLTAGRDFGRILHRLVRNNCWVAQRYAPDDVRERELGQVVSRYACIAVKEQAAPGLTGGLSDLFATLNSQPRAPMPRALWDRFTGLSHVRSTLQRKISVLGRAVAVVEPGKNEWAVRQALDELGVDITNDTLVAETLVIGTLSPGPMLDAQGKYEACGKAVVCPWQFSGEPWAANCAAYAPVLVPDDAGRDNFKHDRSAH